MAKRVLSLLSLVILMVYAIFPVFASDTETIGSDGNEETDFC